MLTTQLWEGSYTYLFKLLQLRSMTFLPLSLVAYHHTTAPPSPVADLDRGGGPALPLIPVCTTCSTLDGVLILESSLLSKALTLCPEPLRGHLYPEAQMCETHDIWWTISG